MPRAKNNILAFPAAPPGNKEIDIYHPSDLRKDMLIDSHTHLEMRDFDEDRDQVVERAQEAGVE
ncbi:MAG: hypothetical protein ABIH04_06420, partial [Planctomycetota bacterium]